MLLYVVLFCVRMKQGLPKFPNHGKAQTWLIGLTFCAFIVVERFFAYTAVTGSLLPANYSLLWIRGVV